MSVSTITSILLLILSSGSLALAVGFNASCPWVSRTENPVYSDEMNFCVSCLYTTDTLLTQRIASGTWITAECGQTALITAVRIGHQYWT